MPLPDISEWYTADRIAAEEAIWTQGAHYIENARRIKEACRVHGLHTIVEAGCGTGWVPTVLSPHLTYLAGIDRNPSMLAIAREKSPAIARRFHRYDLRYASSLPVFADLVCSFAVLKHFSLDDWPIVLREILSLGRYGLFNQHSLNDGRTAVDVGVEWHNIWPTYDDVVQAIESAGHEIIEWDDTHIDEGMGSAEVYITTKRVKP